MKNYISFNDNGVFLITALINSMIGYCLFGVVGVTFGILTVLFANIVYQAKDDSGNIFYMLFLLSLIIVGGAIGFILKLSIPFYLFLFLLSYFYYVTFNKDVYVDRIIPFFVIFSCMGTTLPSVSIELPLAYLTGVIVSLLMLTLLKRKKYDNAAFKNGLFAKGLYTSPDRLGLRAFIYSVFLFLSLAIPDYLGLYRVYWAPLTFIVLLRPLEVGIIKTTLSRFLGSILGAVFLFLMFHFVLFKNTYFDIVILVFVIFLMPTFLKLNYVLKTFAITVFVLLLLEETEFWHDPTYLLPYSRVYETLIGGSIAICASLVLKLARKVKIR
ncbi:FUSC family protein [Orbus wheelerorum]|uniref:FUSC family protein n=1 Tax=Orbus wheelerorum TaxID=3074111 RepID=UPI00370D1901